MSCDLVGCPKKTEMRYLLTKLCLTFLGKPEFAKYE